MNGSCHAEALNCYTIQRHYIAGSTSTVIGCSSIYQVAGHMSLIPFSTLYTGTGSSALGCIPLLSLLRILP